MVNSYISKDQEILGGIPIFTGTRVPVKTLIDYLEQGQPLAAFLDDFPTVSEQAAKGVLKSLKQEFEEAA